MTDLVPHSPDATTRVIAQRMRQLRRERGWTAQRMAEEMTRAGFPWKEAAVTKLETNRRKSVGVEELFAISYALKVSPLSLLISIDDGESSDHDAPRLDAYRWAVAQLAAPQTPIRLKPGDVLNAKVGDAPVKLTVVAVGTSGDSSEGVLHRYRRARGGP